MKTETSKLSQIAIDLENAERPYMMLPRETIEAHLAWCNMWLTDSQHDCLRARGDKRWQEVSLLATKAQALLQIF